jgi:hypothetical protein
MADVDLEKLPGPAKKILGPGAPTPLKLMAAKGVIPGLKPGDIVTVIALLTEATEPEVASTASATLKKLPPPVMTGALGADLEPFVIRLLADAYSAEIDVVEKLARMPRIDGDALALLAERATEKMGEIIAVNEQRLLENPRVIEKLYMNKNVRMSTSDRLLELAVRNDIELAIPAFREAAAAIRNELIPEPTEAPTYDDVLFAQTEQLAGHLHLESAEDDTHEVDDEGEEQLKPKFVPLHAQIAQMTVSQKIRRATLGSAAERMLLVRDNNRLVSIAAVKSPMMREDEAVRVSALRSMSEEVLREIAKNRDFTRNYQVRLNLVMNPRTPFSFASRLLSLLYDHDLVKLARSKNVPGAIAQAVDQHLQKKKKSSARR